MAHSTNGLQTQMQIDPKDRPRYNKDQLETYFKRIQLPGKDLLSPIFTDPSLAKSKEHGLPLLHAITRHHTCHVPFENLELHYSAHKTISLDMDELYKKFADDGLKYGRGGRCMENNGFFGTVLRSIGFDVRNCGGRVSRFFSANPEVREKQMNTYDGWNHMLNLVRLDGQWYVVDVGMGAMGPNIPYPLQDGYETESIAPRKIRIQNRCIAEHAAENEDEAQKLWCFDVCHHPGADGVDKWIPTYCFTETEFLPQDYEMMSWFTSTSPRSFFTFSVLCTKMLMDDAGEKIIGDITLFNDAVRKTEKGEREVLRELRTEQERVETLKELFDVNLEPEEVDGIPEKLRIH
ncbi:Hypothetical protein R9X50_00306700 [Acrodontium crateriforme]|uniref:Arylamine N-acetyltransferase n=1 Tax=Acrodontium crateriforme TaxID=150365 RepID=A0AAQ3M262_9PEZI|nr:Hypothetical protein R9X50_00306700 [Acrodontium crateriforme]